MKNDAQWIDRQDYDTNAAGLHTTTVIDDSVEDVKNYESTVAIVYGRTTDELKARGIAIESLPSMLKSLSALVEQVDAYRAGWLGTAWRDRIGLEENLETARDILSKCKEL